MLASTTMASSSPAWGIAAASAGRPATSSFPAGCKSSTCRPVPLSRRALPAVGPVTARATASGDASDATLHASAGGVGDADVENVVIIGSGPAGYTAAIYAGRASLAPLMFEGLTAGGVPGGQLMTTTEVENFPGFPEGITGPNLMDKMRQQAERWGALLHTEDVETVDFSVRPFVITSTERTVRAHSVILATGATAKRLGIPSEATFWSKGISACAICDGPSPLFKGEDLAVVGGGDTAAEEALYLTKYGRHVHLLVRGATMKASKEMQNRALSHKQVTVHFNTECVDATGNNKGFLSGLNLRDTSSGEARKLAVKGMFYGIGHTPNSGFFASQVETDGEGYVVVRGEGVATSVEGVFSAGDLHDKEWCQAVTAAGSGCMAAISAERYLGAKGLLVEKQSQSKAQSEQLAAEQLAASVKTKLHTAAGGAAAAADVVEEDSLSFDASRVRHKGQFALRKLYHESDRVLMVMYSGPNCGPCKRLKPMLDGVLDEYGADVHFVEIDIEADQEIAKAAGVVGTPCVQVFKDKQRIEVLNGVKMKKAYREVIDGAMGVLPAKEEVNA
mmetsp:Transcript_35798/g.89371  ORF Transcript_35798/g.89371 Transcript_35798/m.89371 type:complete len:563 (-) Transcript_35798:295-1983(-)